MKDSTPKKVLLLHGLNGSDSPHWQSWLAGEIAKDYGTVSFPKFTNPDFPDKTLWIKELKQHLKDFRPDVVICHSLANILWFHLCNEEEIQEVEQLFLVAPPSINCDLEELKSFYPVNVPKNLYAKESILISSTNDPYMTLDEAKSLQNELDIEMKVIKDGGHINADSSYGEWPWILERYHSLTKY